MSHGYLPRDFVKTQSFQLLKTNQEIPVIKQITEQLH